MLQSNGLALGFFLFFVVLRSCLDLFSSLLRFCIKFTLPASFGYFNNLCFVRRIANCCEFSVDESCHMRLCFQAQSFLSLTRAVKQEDG